MGSLDASQKWSLSGNKVFFAFNYKNIWCKLLPKEEKSWISETWPFLNFLIRPGILLHCVLYTSPINNYCKKHIEKSPPWWKITQKLLSVTIHRCAQIDFDDVSYMSYQNKDESSGNHIANWADTAFNNCSRLWKLVHISYLAASLILWNYNLTKVLIL